MTKSRHLNRARFNWSQEHDALVRALYPFSTARSLARLLGCTETSLYQHCNKLGISKSQWFKDSLMASRLRREGAPGAEFRFKKGHVPANKGVKGINYPGMVATQFKPGSRGGRADLLYQPIGAERLFDGYLQRKTNDDLPFHHRWKKVHVLLWEEINGPVPDGHVIVFKDKDKTNIVIENLELISRSDLMKRNSYHNYPKEIAQAIQLKGAINRRINRMEKANAE